MTAGQPDWTRQVAVTVFDTPDNITVNVQAPTTPLSVEFPAKQDVNIESQTANLDVDIASVPANMTVVPSLAVISNRTAAFEDASFVTGDSPATHDVNAALGKNGVDGYIVCDGAGDIKINISNDGTTYGGTHTLKKNDILNLRHLDVDSIKVTWVTNSAYRILVV